MTASAYKSTHNKNLNPPHVGLTTVLKIYACPADGRLGSPVTDDRGFTAAYGSYEGVGGGVSRPGGGYDGVMRAPVGVRLAEVTDGASSTLMFGEKPPWCRYFGGTWYASMVPDPEIIYDVNWTGGAIGATHVAADGALNNGCRGPFKYGPGRLENRCDQTHFWSLHRAGANFAIADGSVRIVRYTAEPVMISLATRPGGETAAVPD